MTTRTIAVCWVDDGEEARLRAPNGAVLADVWVGRYGGWLWETFDASGVDCASREEAKAAAEASLGAVAAEVGCSRTTIQQVEDAVPSLAHGPAAARYELLLSRLERAE